MDVFEAFEEAIVSDRWELGQLVSGTLRGKEFSNPIACDVIVDEEAYANPDRSPEVEYQESDTLIYAMPEQMPTLHPAQLTNGYLWHDTETDTFYEIREASLGKNQETGEIEHLEFLIRPTLVAINE